MIFRNFRVLLSYLWLFSCHGELAKGSAPSPEEIGRIGGGLLSLTQGNAATKIVHPDGTTSIAHKIFAPGVDFSRLEAILAANFVLLFGSKTRTELANNFKPVLEQFKVSHLELTVDLEVQIHSPDLGVSLWSAIYNGEKCFVVRNILNDSLAETKGLKEGDVILKPKQSETPAGRQDRKFILDFRSLTDDGDIKRGQIVLSQQEAEATASARKAPPVSLQIFDSGKNKAAVLRIEHFESEEIFKAVQESVITLNSLEKSHLLVIDLRANNGGREAVMEKVGQLFYPNQIPDVSISKEEWEKLGTSKKALSGIEIFDSYKEARKSWFSKLMNEVDIVPFEGQNIAVLVDSQTASSAELLAAALRNLKEAKIYGQKTARMVLGSHCIRFVPWATLSYPYLGYFTCKGENLEGVGVNPDVSFTDEEMLDMPFSTVHPAIARVVEFEAQ